MLRPNYGLELPEPQIFEFGYNILRGIEVKISRQDFKKGFSVSGCNYHYLLAPMRMVAPYEVPKGVGLIEFNKYKFSCELKTGNKYELKKRAFELKGIRLTKKPRFRNIPQFQIDSAISEISMKNFMKKITKLSEEIQGCSPR
jgi:hypothetical protein